MTNGSRAREAAGIDELPRLPDLLPVLPLKEAVIYPYIIVPLSIGRDASLKAVDQAPRSRSRAPPISTPSAPPRRSCAC